MNKDALLKNMDSFIDEFIRFRKMLEDGDRESMREVMRKSTERRTLFDKPVAK